MKYPHHLRRSGKFQIAAGVCAGLITGAAIFAGMRMAGVAAVEPHAGAAPASITARPYNAARFADLQGHSASPDVVYVADWVADSRDAAGADFVIIDKIDARIYVFDGNARLRDSSPVLLGAALGDDSVPDIGSRPLSQVLPAERTTAAGRFVGERGHDTRGDDVVWVDYDAALSMHRVITTNLQERRLERLASATSADNRISYGCINVPVAFYETYLQSTFARQQAIIYVIPEIKSIQQVFGAYDVARVHGVTRNQTKAMSALMQ